MVNSEENDFYIVGLGASAGGLEALNSFFDNLPADINLAFVVIQHLSPDHESHMADILSKHTLMDVYETEDGMEIEPNAIYLIPPKKEMTIFHRQLFLKDREQNKAHLSLPIDKFFRSLAQDQGERAIGIILSGTGSDGTRGIRAIKEENGMVMVQDPDDAKFDGMPRNANSTGVVDYTLDVIDMGQRLIDYVHHPYISKDKKLKKAKNNDQDTITKILAVLQDEIGVDFTYYKQNTIIRRIERRMVINQREKLEDYFSFLRGNVSEIRTLYKELLIGVTEFFRDKEAFELIETEVIPEIISNKSSGDEVRVWVNGCSTGEEAYSIAILLQEYMEENDINFDVKIFATDISKDAIRQASIGEYPASIAADVSINRLEKYFVKNGDRYKVNEKVRKTVIFSVHNVIKDPPFHKMDLITCRNLLIYFKVELQQKIFSIFHFALKNKGFLFLGSSESIGDMQSYFATYNSKWRIYRCKNKHGTKISKDAVNNLNLETDFNSDKFQVDFEGNYNHKRSNVQEKIIEKINDRLVDKYIPPSAIIDENNQLIHVVGNVNKYLQIPINKVSLNVLDMAPKSLSLILNVSINRVRREKEEVVYKNFQVEEKQELGVVDVQISPLFTSKDERELIAISFIAVDEEEEGQSIEEVEPGQQERINELEKELDYTKENLRATIEELEASNQELQATNEELLASNEELQSTNEELESVNEELVTVNSEHQEKIEELTKLNNDINNLLKSTNIGTIFLDEELKIRKFTSVVDENINLKERDIGRPLKDISHNIKYDNLFTDCEEVLETLIPKESRIETDNGDWHLVKIHPYRTEQDEIKGVVITFIDITKLKMANKRLQKLRDAVNKSPHMVMITDTDGIIEYANNASVNRTGYSKDELIGNSPSILQSPKTSKAKYKELWNTITAGEKWTGEFCNQKKNGQLYWEKAIIFPLLDEEGEISSYIKFAENIDAQKAREEEIKQLREGKQRLRKKLDTERDEDD
ncbi:MAG: CheR family methyltransferase [Halanaerobacter sp.]